MSTGLSTAQVKQYDNMVMLLFQQKMQRLREFTQVKTGQIGTMCSFDRVGDAEMTEITGQLDSTTTWTSPQNYRRWAAKRDFAFNVLLDVSSQLEIILDMKSGYAQTGAAAAARKADKLIIDAVTATALSGKEGVATSAFDATAPTASGGGGNEIVTSSVGMTGEKLEEANAIFNAREVAVDEMDEDGRVCVMGATQMRELMEDTRAVSRDFYEDPQRGRMPLVRGRIPYYMGFHLRVSNQLNLNSAGARRVLAWHRNAMGFGLWIEMLSFIGQLPEHNLATGIIMQKYANAVRVDDKGVLAIACVES